MNHSAKSLSTSLPLGLVLTTIALATGACDWGHDREPFAKQMGEGTLAPERELQLLQDTAEMAAAHRRLLENVPTSDLEKKRREWGLAFCTATVRAIENQDYVLHEVSEHFENHFDDRYATFTVQAYVDESDRQMALTLPFLKVGNPWLENGGAPH